MTKTLALIIFVLAISASGAVTKSTSSFRLGNTEIRLAVYSDPASNVTFFVPHHNEQVAVQAAREFVHARGGRLVEIENFDRKGRPARMIEFELEGRQYAVDPNRIFTESGRTCGVPPAARPAVAAFAERVLQLLFDGDIEAFRRSGRSIVAVHNNADSESKRESLRSGDLTAFAFVNTGLTAGPFSRQASGVFISNAETDPDNFVLLSEPRHAAYFSSFGFHVILQRPASSLAGGGCEIDDGSMSVFAGLNRIPYICLEADAESGAIRQRQMLESVYGLPLRETPAGPSTVADRISR